MDTTERLHFHFSLSCIGEGNGNPLQCSCLENPGDGGASWAAISGVAQSRTWLKRFSSSSSRAIKSLNTQGTKSHRNRFFERWTPNLQLYFSLVSSFLEIEKLKIMFRNLTGKGNRNWSSVLNKEGGLC